VQGLLDQVGGASVPRLPASPLAARWLLEQPLPLVGFLGAGAILAWFVLNRSGKNRAALGVAGGLFALAAGVYVLASVVQTTRELLIDRTRALVDHVTKVDVAAIAPMLDESFTVRYWGYDRQKTLDEVAREMSSRAAVKDYQINQALAAVDGPNVARTQVHVRATLANSPYGVPIGSWWLLHWQKDERDGVWRVVELEAQQGDGVQDIRSRQHP
jgi:hypothetical protein